MWNLLHRWSPVTAVDGVTLDSWYEQGSTPSLSDEDALNYSRKVSPIAGSLSSHCTLCSLFVTRNYEPLWPLLFLNYMYLLMWFSNLQEFLVTRLSIKKTHTVLKRFVKQQLLVNQETSERLEATAVSSQISILLPNPPLYVYNVSCLRVSFFIEGNLRYSLTGVLYLKLSGHFDRWNLSCSVERFIKRALRPDNLLVEIIGLPTTLI